MLSCSCFHHLMFSFSFSFALPILRHIALPVWRGARCRPPAVVVHRIPNRLHQTLVGIRIIVIGGITAVETDSPVMIWCAAAMDFTHCSSWRRIWAH